MDFAKAFDKVHHSLLVLLHKLHHYGIRGEVSRWIGSFLFNRHLTADQAVVVEGVRSDFHFVSVKSGVPQGSVFGPCMFLVYINQSSQLLPFKGCLHPLLVFLGGINYHPLFKNFEGISFRLRNCQHTH